MLIVSLPVNAIAKSFAIAAGINFFFFTVYYGNIFNIGSLFMSLFLFMIACSQAKLTEIEQNDFALLTWLTLFSVIVCFYATIFIYQKIHHNKTMLINKNYTYNFSNRTVFLVNISLLILEIIIYSYAFNKLGGIPLFNDYLRAVQMTALLGNYLMTIMVLPIMLIIFDIVYIVQKKKYFYFIFIFIFITMLMLLGGRINVFIPITTSIFYLLLELHYKKYKKSYLFVVGTILIVLLLALMLIIPLIRTSIYSGSGTEYYDIIYDVPNDTEIQSNISVQESTASQNNVSTSLEIPSFLKPIWVNFSTEMHGFDWMVKILSETKEFQYGNMFLHGPLNFIFKHITPSPQVDVLKYDWLNVLTFMQKPYMDFGIFGVMIFIIIYTIIGMIAYNYALQKKSMFCILFYAYYCMSTLFFVFENHFMYTTYIINTVLLLLFAWALAIDWIHELYKFHKKLLKIISK